MPSERLRAASHLFTVRLWSEDLGDDQVGMARSGDARVERRGALFSRVARS